MYLKAAIGLETMRILVSKFANIKQSPARLPIIYARSLNWRIVAFLVGYAGAYRAINCSLNRHTMSNTQAVRRIAAFVAAACYYVYPNRTVLAHAVVTAVRLAWSQLTDDDKDNEWCPPWLAKLGKLNCSYFFHMLGTGLLFHLRVFYPFWCSSMLMKTTSYLSGLK